MHAINDTNGTESVIGEPEDIAAGSAEFSLNRGHTLGTGLETLLKKLFEDVHLVSLAETFIPKLPGSMMKPCADLYDHFV
jgi:hypothetical protein